MYVLRHTLDGRNWARLMSNPWHRRCSGVVIVKLPTLLLTGFLSLAIACTTQQRSSTGVAFASVGGLVSIAAVEGLQGSTADGKSNDAAATVLVAGVVLLALGAILYADARKR